MDCNLIYIVVYLVFGISVEAAARTYGRCPALKLKNGSVKLRPNGRMARFRCNFSYHLVGNSYALCTSGRWEVPMPVCIKSGCNELPAIANGIHDITHDGSLARFVCHYGFELEGPREIFCNGVMWNDTIPKCRGTKDVSKFGCNFDSGMCGWDNDELHDFNWRRKLMGPNVTHLAWMPSTDHTNSSTGPGGYVYTERQSTVTNQSAKLLSPSYHSDLTKDGCFTFYYYRSNPFLGQLKIYQKPDSVDITTLTSTEKGRKYLRFQSTSGIYGRWENGFFHLNESDEDFQIVIEGYEGRRLFAAGSLAVDDVAIMQGHQCIVNITTDTTTEVDFRYSCANRCGSKAHLSLFSSFKVCGCEESCLLIDSCCADFRDICEFGTEEDTTTEVITTEITSSLTTKEKKSSERTNSVIIFPSSRDLITQRANSKPTPKPFSTTIYVPSFKGTYTTTKAISTRVTYFNTSVPVTQTTTTSRSSRATGTTKAIPDSGKSNTRLSSISTSTKKIPTFYRWLGYSTTPTTFFPRWTTSSTTYKTTFTSTTREVTLSTTTPRFYEGDGKTAQTNQTDKDVAAQQKIEDERSSYARRMKGTTICLAVFLCICGSSILIMLVVKRRNQIRSLITRLRIRHEFAKSHAAKESDVRFLIREDEVDLE